VSARRPLLIPVLGMHRSGTSIATRGLACLGAHLGDALLDGGIDDNPTGYFEDEALHTISERVFDAVGSRWHDLSDLDAGVFDSAAVESLRADAHLVLRERLEAHGIYAFKNPRTCRLRRFWAPVFERLEADVRAVCVVRHPLSVVHSLATRDDFDPVKSAHLWVTHSVEAALGVNAAPASCIDYDALFEDAAGVLGRVARDLDVADPDPARVEEFSASLLDPGLRHSRFDQTELEADPRMGPIAAAVWPVLRACGRGEARLDDAGVREELERAAMYTKYVG